MKIGTKLATLLALTSSLCASQVLLEERRAETALTVIEGVVLTPDGRPAAGATVVTSAGGKTVSGADGFFRIALELPLDACEVRASAAMNAGQSAIAGSARIAAAPGTTSPGAVIRLGVTGCEPQGVPTFGGVRTFDDVVNVLAVFDDGSGAGPMIIAGGNMTRAGAFPATGLARFDGTGWAPLGGGMDGPVMDLEVFDDGSGPALYVAGWFTTASGLAANRIVRWDGTSWSVLGAGLNGNAQAMVVLDDGSGPALYVGGSFTTAGGVAASRVARWDGTTWSALGAGVSSTVFALEAHDDGSGPALFAGGSFTLAGGLPANRIARWDGASWSALGSGMNSRVFTLASHTDHSGTFLLAGGEFLNAGGAPASKVAQWDGASWSPLGSGLSNGDVQSLVVFNDVSGSRLHARGTFTGANGSNHSQWDGTTWSPVGDLLLHGEGKGLVVFDDGSGNGAELYTDTEAWDGGDWRVIVQDPPVFDDTVLALAVMDDAGPGGPALYASGHFTSAGETVLNRVAKWDGASWLPLGSGTSGSVNALEVYDDGGGEELYAGGSFTLAGGESVNRIARWDGTSWTSLGLGVNSTVQALEVFDDGGGPALYVGGQFTIAGGPSNRIARWNGSNWSQLASGVSSTVNTMEVFDDGSGPALYVGGSFTVASGVTVNRIARWNGTSWSALGSGTSGAVLALAVFDDGSGGGPALYAGGSFLIAGGISASSVAKWDGTSWSPLATGMNSAVNALEVFDDGSGPSLYAGGSFSTADGMAASRIARWNGTSWTPLGSGVNVPIQPITTPNTRALIVFDDGASGPALIVGGQFLGAFDAGDSYIARWQGCIDTSAPLLTLPDSVHAVDAFTGTPGEIVHFTVSASDFFDVAPTVVCVPPSGSFFARGTTLVNCTATDESGNQAVGSFTVVVEPKLRQRTR